MFWQPLPRWRFGLLCVARSQGNACVAGPPTRNGPPRSRSDRLVPETCLGSRMENAVAAEAGLLLVPRQITEATFAAGDRVSTGIVASGVPRDRPERLILIDKTADATSILPCAGASRESRTLYHWRSSGDAPAVACAAHANSARR